MVNKVYKISLITILVFAFSAIAYAGWSSSQNISSNNTWSSEPAVVSAGGKVYIVWSDSSGIYFKWHNGTSWSQKMKVNSGEWDMPDQPKLAVAEGKIHIVWRHYGNDKYETYYRRFNGSSWTTIRNVSESSGYSNDPLVAAYKNKAFIVWAEDKNKDFTDDEIMYRKVSGTTWSGKYNVSATSSSESTEPSISIDGENLRVVWTENKSGNREIFYRFFKP